MKLLINSIFDIFDPFNTVNLPLNWVRLLGGLILLSPRFYFIEGRYTAFIILIKNILIVKEYPAIIGPLFLKGSLQLLIPLIIFIIYSNFFGLLPYVFTPTSRGVVTLVLSLFLWLAVIVGWLSEALNDFLRHLVPINTPAVLIPLIVLIELTSRFIRPITLAVRLRANIVAGHLLVQLVNAGPLVAWVFFSGLLGGTLLIVLERAVAFIQRYVYVTLSTLYVSEVNKSIRYS